MLYVRKSSIVSIIVLAFGCLVAPGVSADSEGTHLRWDIFNPVVGPSALTITAGGHSISQATFSSVQAAGDNSTITLTGSGTIRLNEGHDVTGGGTWQTADGSGTVTGSGNYRVTSLVRFEPAPGTLAGVPGFVDAIGNIADTVAGFAVMTIVYDDGQHGILVVSCTIAGPAAMFEGTTATKGNVDYFNALFPDFTYGNTLFHVIHDGD